MTTPAWLSTRTGPNPWASSSRSASAAGVRSLAVATPRRVNIPASLAVPSNGRSAASQSVLPGIVVHRAEPGLFEPPRGPRAHVSKRVVAVHDHRPGSVQLPGTGVQFLEREVDRARQVRPVVLVRGQHLDQLGALAGQLPQLLAPDSGRHGDPPSRLARPPRRGGWPTDTQSPGTARRPSACLLR